MVTSTMQRCSHSLSTASALRSIFFPTSNQTCVSTFLAPSYAPDAPAQLSSRCSRSSATVIATAQIHSSASSQAPRTALRPPTPHALQHHAQNPYISPPPTAQQPGGVQSQVQRQYNTQQRTAYGRQQPGEARRAGGGGAGGGGSRYKPSPQAQAAELRSFGAQKDRRPKDEEIRARTVRLVGGIDGNDGSNDLVSTATVLRTIDRETHCLVQLNEVVVTDAKPTEAEKADGPPASAAVNDDEWTARPSQRQPPASPSPRFHQASGERHTEIVCRVMTRKQYFEYEQRRGNLAAGAAKRPAKTAKQLELSWGIDRNDLGHRLKKAAEFLAGGKKVEILLAPKKRGRAATPDECAGLIREIEAKIKGECGHREQKPAVGKVGGTMTLYFEPK